MAELDQVIEWLTGFDEAALRHHLDAGTTFEDFFAAADLNPGVALITGSTTLAPAGAGAGEDRPVRTAALRVAANGEIERYDQMRRVPVADAPAEAGTERRLLPVGGARVAALLGFDASRYDPIIEAPEA